MIDLFQYGWNFSTFPRLIFDLFKLSKICENLNKFNIQSLFDYSVFDYRIIRLWGIFKNCIDQKIVFEF